MKAPSSEPGTHGATPTKPSPAESNPDDKPTTMPDDIYGGDGEPGSDVYKQLVESTRPSDQPQASGSSSPPSSEEAAREQLNSLRPPAVPSFPARDDGRTTDPIVVGEADEGEGLDVDLDEAFERITSNPPPPPENQTPPPPSPARELALQDLEAFARSSILDDLREQCKIVIRDSGSLTMLQLNNIKKLLIERKWLTKPQELKDAILTILDSIDPKLGLKLRTRENNLNALVNLFLDRLAILGLDAIVISLRDSRPQF